MWTQDQFFEYRMSSHLREIPEGRIPIMQMEHLRQKDLPISRGISYERTAYTFLAQIELSSSVHYFKTFNNAVVLLNEEGAMVCRDGAWSLLFTPDKTEQLTLDPDAELYPVFMGMLEKVQQGKMCEIPLDSISLRSLINNVPNLDILDSYCRSYPGGYLLVSHKIVKEGPEELFAHVPVCRCGKLTTVDLEEREAYQSVITLMKDYIYSVDHSDGEPIRPLSVCVFGAPGSGKSFGVKQIAKSFGRFSVSTLNLSQYTSTEEMFIALDKALTHAEKIPLIFFDEFDSEFQGTSRGWLKSLLAPMQDGEFTVDGELRTIQNAVFVFAGGTASTFSQFMPATPEATAAFKAVKGPDFVSRLRGMLNVKGPNPTAVTDRSAMIRRALLLRDLIIRKMPNVYNPETGIVNISDGLISALLRVSTYRHGTRSMEFILDMSHVSDVKKFTPSCLPLQNQLDIHLDYADFSRKLTFERISGAEFVNFIRATHEKMVQQRLNDSKKYHYSEEQIQKLIHQRSMQPWDETEEALRDSYRNRARELIEHMGDYTFPVGLRPVTEDLSDTIHELYGKSLDAVTKLVYEIWCQSLAEDGWRYGPTVDSVVKTHPGLRPYEEIAERDRDQLQQQMRILPEFLEAVGFEMYRKGV